MYMTITEFRKDISKQFNEAVQGRPVFITRAGQMFKLEAFRPKENKSRNLALSWLEADRLQQAKWAKDNTVVNPKFPPVSTEPIAENIRPKL
jgi:antitoxin (DNA-binding transcriptional repressor) of toxin-antitoxin stability system